MSERPPHNDLEDEQRFDAADFGYNDEDNFKKIGNGGKNGESKERDRDKKPKRGGKREVAAIPNQDALELPHDKPTALKTPESENTFDQFKDPEIKNAAEIVVLKGKVSPSFLVKKLSIGYGQAAKIMEKLENIGVISKRDENGDQTVLWSHEDFVRGKSLATKPTQTPEITSSKPPENKTLSELQKISPEPNPSIKTKPKIDRHKIVTEGRLLLNREKTAHNNTLNNLLDQGIINADQFSQELNRWKNSDSNFVELSQGFQSEKFDEATYKEQIISYIGDRIIPKDWLEKLKEIKAQPEEKTIIKNH